MATHSILAWRFPWAEEPEGLQSVGSHRSHSQSSEPESLGVGASALVVFKSCSGDFDHGEG